MFSASLRRCAVAGLVVLAVFCLAAPAMTQVSVVGSFDMSSSVFDRRKSVPLTPGVSCGALPASEDSYNNDVRYGAYRIVTETQTVLNTSLLASSAPPLDLLLGIYCGDLSPSVPSANLIALDDDGGVYPNPSLSSWGITLQPAQIYTLVVMNYSSEYNTDGSYTLSLPEGIRLLPSLENVIALLQILTGQTPPESAVAPLEALIPETPWNLGHAIQFLKDLTP